MVNEGVGRIHVGRICAWHLTATAASNTNLADSVASCGLFKPASKRISNLPPLDIVNLSSIIPDVCFLLLLGASPTTNIGSISVHQTMRLHIKKHATVTWLQHLPSCCWSSQGSSDIANSSCVKSAWEVVSGGKGAWERAGSLVDARVSRAAGSTVVGVARTRVVSACLVVAICFCLAFFCNTCRMGCRVCRIFRWTLTFYCTISTSRICRIHPLLIPCHSVFLPLSLCHVKSSRQEKWITI